MPRNIGLYAHATLRGIAKILMQRQFNITRLKKMRRYIRRVTTNQFLMLIKTCRAKSGSNLTLPAYIATCEDFFDRKSKYIQYRRQAMCGSSKEEEILRSLNYHFIGPWENLQKSSKAKLFVVWHHSTTLEGLAIQDKVPGSVFFVGKFPEAAKSSRFWQFDRVGDSPLTLARIKKLLASGISVILAVDGENGDRSVPGMILGVPCLLAAGFPMLVKSLQVPVHPVVSDFSGESVKIALGKDIFQGADRSTLDAKDIISQILDSLTEIWKTQDSPCLDIDHLKKVCNDQAMQHADI